MCIHSLLGSLQNNIVVQLLIYYSEWSGGEKQAAQSHAESPCLRGKLTEKGFNFPAGAITTDVSDIWRG